MKRNVYPPDIKLSRAEIKKIIANEKNVFPGDFALQQAHIARDIIGKEAKKAGMNYVEYIIFSNRAEAN
jgi:hypothetical protein